MAMKVALLQSRLFQMTTQTTPYLFEVISDPSIVGSDSETDRRYNSNLKSAVEKCTLHPNPEEKWKLKITFSLVEQPTNVVDIKIDGPLLDILHNLMDGHVKLLFKTDMRRSNRSIVYQTPYEGITAEVKNEDGVSAKVACVIETPVLHTLHYINATTTIQLVSDSDWFMDFGEYDQTKILFKKILNEALYSDFYLISENGKEFPCLKAVLAGSSDELSAMIRREVEENNKFKVELKRAGNGTIGIPISEEGVQGFLEFLYCNQCRRAVRSSFVALELLALGHQYRITSMESAMKKVILEKSAERLGVDVALQIFVHFKSCEGYDDLKKKVVKVLKLQLNQLQQSQWYREFYQSETSRQLFEFTLQQTM